MSDWTKKATCRTAEDVDPELWFPSGYLTAADMAQAEAAKEWCRWCPVIEQCRAFVMQLEAGKAAYLRNGVWGGTTPQERYEADPVAVAKRRKAGVS